MNACQPTYVLYFLNLALHLPLMLPACHLHNFCPPPPLTLSSSNSPRALSTSLATNSQQALALSDAGKDFEQINSVDLFVEVVLVFGVVYYYVLQVVYIYTYVPCTLRQLTPSKSIVLLSLRYTSGWRSLRIRGSETRAIHRKMSG